MNSPSSTSGTEGVAAPAAPMVTNTREGITTDTNATTARAADSTSCTRTGDRARAAIAAADVRSMILLRAILSTIAPDRARALLVALAAWWHAVVALASTHTAAALETAHAAYDAADEHGDATTCAALVAAFTGVDASSLYDIASAPGEASEARNMALVALPMIDALLAELGAAGQGERAPADPREAFARSLLEFSAENNTPSLALVGAEVMFPDYASAAAPGMVHAAVVQVCETVADTIASTWHPTITRLATLERTESAAIMLRDAARIIVAGSHLLDAHVAAALDAAKGAA